MLNVSCKRAPLAPGLSGGAGRLGAHFCSHMFCFATKSMIEPTRGFFRLAYVDSSKAYRKCIHLCLPNDLCYFRIYFLSL